MDAPLLSALFTSRVRVRTLSTFLLNPDVPFYASELARTIDAQYNAVWKELRRLERVGVLLSEASGKSKLYRLNPHLPILPELRALILKTVGVGDHLRRALGRLGTIKTAFIYGSFATGEVDRHSDIDVMIIGQVNLNELAPRIARIEKELGRTVNYVCYTRAEWQMKQGEPFIANVLASPKIMLIGSEDALRTSGATRTAQTVQGAARRNSKTRARRRTRSSRR